MFLRVVYDPSIRFAYDHVQGKLYLLGKIVRNPFGYLRGDSEIPNIPVEKVLGSPYYHLWKKTLKEIQIELDKIIYDRILGPGYRKLAISRKMYKMLLSDNVAVMPAFTTDNRIVTNKPFIVFVEVVSRDISSPYDFISLQGEGPTINT